MRAYLVLVYGGCASPPVLHLVTAKDDATAAVFAGVLLSESRGGVGVRVTNCEGTEIHVQGVVPRRAEYEAATALGEDATVLRSETQR